jgi:MFS family permease
VADRTPKSAHQSPVHGEPPGAGRPSVTGDRAALQRRTLRVLVGSQILGGLAIGVGAAVSPLLAKEILGGDGTFAGVAFASLTLGAAVAAIPLSRLMARRGRRPGLVRGYVVAGSGAAIAVVASEVESFPLLLLGMLLLGWGTSANLLARYAGADLAQPERRARAISTVVWATTIGAVAGPNALGPAGRLAAALGLPRMAGPYVIGMACFAVAALIVATLLRPDPLIAAGGGSAGGTEQPWRSVTARLAGIWRDRAASAGLAVMVAAHGVMVSLMTMTPLHLRDHGDSLELVGLVISLHIAGMYALAPVVGSVADRIGHLRMAYAATLTLIAAAGLAAAAGQAHLLISAALVLLGLGWSMATIAGSTLLTASVAADERAEAQGVADMTMGIVGGAGGTVSGIVVGTVGYAVLSLVGVLITAGLLLLLLMRARTMRARPTVEGGGPAGLYGGFDTVGREQIFRGKER